MFGFNRKKKDYEFVSLDPEFTLFVKVHYHNSPTGDTFEASGCSICDRFLQIVLLTGQLKCINTSVIRSFDVFKKYTVKRETNNE